METMYQRSKIQEESLHYETMKHTGSYPIIGVNTFLSSKGSPTIIPSEVIRATDQEKKRQIHTVNHLQSNQKSARKDALEALKTAAEKNENIFSVLMEAVKIASLGQITQVLFNVGGQYRRNM